MHNAHFSVRNILGGCAAVAMILITPQAVYAQQTLDSDLKGNTAAGSAALSSNTTGTDNTAVGLNALYLNTVGIDNVAVGAGTLFNNTKGTVNTAVVLGTVKN